MNLLSGHIPLAIKTPLEYLISLKKVKTRLESSYGKYMQDIGTNEFRFKCGKNILDTNFHIVDREHFQKNANPAEMELLKLYDALHSWIQEVYEKLKAI